jgi:hypothetical protein
MAQEGGSGVNAEEMVPLPDLLACNINEIKQSCLRGFFKYFNAKIKQK